MWSGRVKQKLNIVLFKHHYILLKKNYFLRVLTHVETRGVLKATIDLIKEIVLTHIAFINPLAQELFFFLF